MDKKKLIKFRENLKEYRRLLSVSTGPLLEIEKNHKQIEILHSSLIAQFAELEDTISEYSQGPLYIDQAWGIQVSAYETALSNDIIQRRGPAIDAVLNDLDYVIAKCKTNKAPHAKNNLYITIDSLQPKIVEHCKSRFESGHYSDAVLTAYKVVLNELKLITGLDEDGKSLVEKAFSINSPAIRLNDLKTKSDKDEQIGFMLLYSGAAVGIRNPKAHDLVDLEDPAKALHYLSFASLLMQRLDERAEPR